VLAFFKGTEQRPDGPRWTWLSKITIHNLGETAVQIIERHLTETDGIVGAAGTDGSRSDEDSSDASAGAGGIGLDASASAESGGAGAGAEGKPPSTRGKRGRGLAGSMRVIGPKRGYSFLTEAKLRSPQGSIGGHYCAVFPLPEEHGWARVNLEIPEVPLWCPDSHATPPAGEADGGDNVGQSTTQAPKAGAGTRSGGGGGDGDGGGDGGGSSSRAKSNGCRGRQPIAAAGPRGSSKARTAAPKAALPPTGGPTAPIRAGGNGLGNGDGGDGGDGGFTGGKGPEP
jgi:uncharacterized protein affecting Mg2+/Co2+ transport